MIDFTYTKARITDVDLENVEKQFNFNFPDEFKKHYLTYNGGRPKKNIFTDEDGFEFIVSEFIAVKDGENNLENTLKSLRVDPILPNWFIPFANDPGGNMFGFCIDEAEYGAIYYWNHEYEYGEDPDEHVTFLADTLEEFLEGLKADEDD